MGTKIDKRNNTEIGFDINENAKWFQLKKKNHMGK